MFFLLENTDCFNIFIFPYKIVIKVLVLIDSYTFAFMVYPLPAALESPKGRVGRLFRGSLFCPKGELFNFKNGILGAFLAHVPLFWP